MKDRAVIKLSFRIVFKVFAEIGALSLNSSISMLPIDVFISTIVLFAMTAILIHVAATATKLVFNISLPQHLDVIRFRYINRSV